MPTFQFHWLDAALLEEGTDSEKYQRIVQWAQKARSVNPDVFDALTRWLLDAETWNSQEWGENRNLLINGIFGKFLAQNALLRETLASLKPSGNVNPPVFEALDRFDDELLGNTHTAELIEAVTAVFSDFTALRVRETRELFAGSPTGHFGTDWVETYGYMNFLSDCDSAVQWALFMPDLVQQQQKGFRMESFEYKKLPAMRFIGKEKDFSRDPEGLEELFHTLDLLSEYRSGFDWDMLFIHHRAKGVDVEPPHKLWGRFMAVNAPVPEGFEAIEFAPQDNHRPGQPYLSQFAYAVFAGDQNALHQREGFDSDAMYDVTRNTILGQNIPIPYPEKYWTAEVFPEGPANGSYIYLFSAQIS